MVDPFMSVWLKLDHARYRADELNRQIGEFWATKPYQLETSGDPKSGPCVFTIRGEPAPIPYAITLTIGDAFHAMRSAYDHFAVAAAGPVKGTSVTFPVWRPARTPNAVEWRSSVLAKLRMTTTAVQNHVLSMEPWPGGADEWLWALDTVDIIDKHRLLLTVAGATAGMEIDVMESFRTSFPDNPDFQDEEPFSFRVRAAEWEPVVQGAVVFTSEAPGGVPFTPKVVFEVSLREPEVLQRHSVIDVLHDLLNKSELTLRALAAVA